MQTKEQKKVKLDEIEKELKKGSGLNI